MNRILPAALLAAVALTFATAQAADRKPLNVRDLVSFERVSDPRVSPDGRYVAYTVRATDLDANKGVRSIWLLNLKTKATLKLTAGGGNSDSPRWSADSSHVYFLSTRSGSTQVWRLSLKGGEAQAVTKLPVDVGTFTLSPDGQKLALTLDVFTDCDTLACSAKRLKEQESPKNGTGKLYDKLFVRHWDQWSTGTRSQLFVANLKADGAAETPKLVSRGIDGDIPSKPFGDDTEYAFAADSKSVFFSARVAGKTEAWSTNFDLFQVPTDGSAAPKNLTADNLAWDTHPLVTPNGKSLIYLAMKRPGFESDRFAIMIRDLKTGKTKEVAPRWDRSPSQIALSDNGTTLYAVADDLGQAPLFAINLSSGVLKKLTGAGSITGFGLAPDGFVFTSNRLDAPDNLYRMSWNGSVSQLSTHNAEALAGIEMAPYEQFSFPGWNEETVYGYVVKPAGWQSGKKYPVAFIIHGGPQGSMGNLFHYRWNPEVFAGMGYAVVFIDFHGSTGYGQAFTDSISGDWGGKPLEDLKKGWAYAQKNYDWLDGGKACALGASYGGYMINWIQGNWQGAFDCLVNHDGVFDNRSMAYSTEELWFDEWENKGVPYEKPENYERFNPVTKVDRWKTPMLVIHSENDFRVPPEQGIAAFTALQRRGIESQLLYFPDESHWVQKPQNSIQWHDSVQAWLDRWLKK